MALLPEAGMIGVYLFRSPSSSVSPRPREPLFPPPCFGIDALPRRWLQ